LCANLTGTADLRIFCARPPGTDDANSIRLVYFWDRLNSQRRVFRAAGWDAHNIDLKGYHYDKAF
jgi:hypothetical protein